MDPGTKQSFILASAVSLLRQMRTAGLDHFDQVAALQIASTLLALEPYPSNSVNPYTQSKSQDCAQ